MPDNPKLIPQTDKPKTASKKVGRRKQKGVLTSNTHLPPDDRIFVNCEGANKNFMTDTHSKETRSYNMSRIKGKNTKPELVVRRFLFANGFRYRLHAKNLPGKPDIVLPKYKTVIFVNGCFWHGHQNCKYFVPPKTRTEWWLQKITNTQKRDRQAKTELQSLGWRVITIWECELKPKKVEERLNALLSYLLSMK
ncbi:very short patch repair endonuclease [Labilibaculum euxinus]|uniref:very short patch repair endonuclease n=1 Tax=Labilibaculum euxinus TaxID=2686357 RepID=UPI001CDD11D4|nr:DNA mismatch endonuclease Vsr [Labilibaculum euxinus]MDQ1769959.1 DNA mismatch endonuclease Vsr [Labilibaculum euxinus]